MVPGYSLKLLSNKFDFIYFVKYITKSWFNVPESVLLSKPVGQIVCMVVWRGVTAEYVMEIGWGDNLIKNLGSQNLVANVWISHLH